MHDFGHFCYLDMQKTGSCFISNFLTQHSATPEIENIKHGRIDRREQVRPDGKLFFISVRDPFELYRSLYYFGCAGRGRFRKGLDRQLGARTDAIYDGTEDGFYRWLDFVLDHGNAGLFGESYAETRPKLFGIMTHRFFMLSFFRPLRTLANASSRDKILAIYRKRRLHAHILRNENLNRDLADLVRGPLGPYLKDRDKALELLNSDPPRVNQTPYGDSSGQIGLNDHFRALIAEREWFFFEELAYAGQLTQAMK